MSPEKRARRNGNFRAERAERNRDQRRESMAGARGPVVAAARAVRPVRLASRNFLPGLGQLASSGLGSRRRTLRKQSVVPHAQEIIFDVVAAVEEYDSFLPWCTSSRVLRRSADPRKFESVITVGFESITADFHSSVELDPHERVHATTRPNRFLDSLSFTWELAPLGASMCRLDLLLDFELAKQEHVVLWDLVHPRIVDEYLACFLRRCATAERERSKAQCERVA